MQLKFEVKGMTCAACSARVEKVSGQLEGVSNVAVNLLAGTMTAEVESPELAAQIIDAIENAGYSAQLFGERKPEKAEKPQRMEQELSAMGHRIVFSAVFLVVLMYFTMGHMVGLPVPGWYHGTKNALVAALLQFFLTLPVVVINSVYYKKGLKALSNRGPNMDSLIAVGSGAALVYGVAALFRMAYAMGQGQWDVVESYSKNLYFESAAMILTLITLGKFLESRAKGKTGDAIRQLMDLSPKTATVIRGGLQVDLPIEEVQTGDIIIVRSGGSIPVDGTILEGRASIDQSALTGESVPVEKSVGDTVSAATINTDGFLRIRADKVGEDTTLSQVIRLVEEAGGSKAPIARLADKIAGIFVPVVMGIAAVTLIGWLVAGYDLEFALNNAISVLVISCPCALGLATPVAIMVGTGTGARMGVLFKNAQALENLHNVNAAVLDKTGTVTSGKPAVTDVIAAEANEEELLRIAAALEAKSEHPFAKAIMEKVKGMDYTVAEDFEAIPGKGVCGKIAGKKYYAGNRRLMSERNITVDPYDELSNQGKTPLYFADETGKFYGAIFAADVIKEDTFEAVQALKRMHIDVIMLTGDKKSTADAIAQKAGIDHVISDVLPTDKASVMEELKQGGKHVVMVGDGINDAPALVGADVGIAIGAGTDIAIESADIVLMNSSLSGVYRAIGLSKATIRNIRQNLFWAFFYNCLGIPLAAGLFYPAFGIQLSPMIGAAAMSLSSVFVVTNALRLRFYKPKHFEVIQQENSIQEVNDMETVIKVEGMMCMHCKARVENVCKAVPGAVDAVVDLEAKQVTVKGDAAAEALKKAITEAGYEVIG